NNEDPVQVPLVFSPSWVQVNDLPLDFFSESVAKQLGNFVGCFVEYSAKPLRDEVLELGWNSNLKAQFRRAVVENSVWFRRKKRPRIVFLDSSVSGMEDSIGTMNEQNNAIRRLQHMLEIYNPQIIFLMETKLNSDRMERVRKHCGFSNGIDNHIDVENLMDDNVVNGDKPDSTISRMCASERKGLQDKLGRLLELDRDDDTLVEIIDMKIHLNMEIEKEEAYWEQRARTNWLKMRDRNTKFFHSFASQRRRSHRIWKLVDELDNVATSKTEVEEFARKYFTNIFASRGMGNMEHILTGVDTCITAKMNQMLLANYTYDKVVSALKSMGPTKTIGSGRFPVIPRKLL
ncbi:hypothetical protein Gotri_022889, partial [Gossypium trilobum]|nr:hypothetical protein [Gossypium trilobum]